MSGNFKPTQDDKTWKFIEAHLQKVIENCDSEWGNKSTTYERILELRGRKGLAKEILSLPGLEELTRK